MIQPHISHYFSHHLNKEIKEVYLQALLFNLGLSMAFIFEPIFLFKLGYSISHILGFYCLVYIFYSFFVFAGAKFASKAGYKHSILLSNFFYIIYWIVLYQMGSYPELYWIAPACFAMQKAFFWPAYNAEIAISSAKDQRGREMGVLFSLIEVAMIVGPFIGGWLSMYWGFKVLFFTSSVLIMASTYPLFQSPEVYSQHSFTFKNFTRIFAKYRQNFFGYWGYAEDLMLMTLWPILVFTSVAGVFGVGVVTTVASVIATVLMLYVGKLADRFSKKDLIQLSALYYGLTWVFRFWVAKVGSVLAFDVLGRTGKGMVNVAMVSLTNELAGGKTNDHAIAYSVFYEFSIAVGKVVAALGALFIFEITGSIEWVFVFAGILTMFYGLLKK
jgi:MFS family permease